MGDIESTTIRYDWPPGGTDPFAADDGPTRWVFRTTERSPWGRAWPAGDARGFGGFGDFVERVPMGYKAIQLYERLAIVQDGQVLGRWAETAAPSATSELSERSGGVYAVMPQRQVTVAAADLPAATDADGLIRRAIARSLVTPGIAFLAGRCLRHQTWH
ncbi:hypothetical protein [Actinophytocola sediminis]